MLRTVFFFALSLCTLSAHADPIEKYFRLALANDPVYAAARAQYEADLRHKRIGRANLLPTVSLVAAIGNTRYERRDLAPVRSSDADYDPSNISLRLTQPVFDLGKWAAWREGDARSRLAEVVFLDARQEVELRFARAWYEYLLARDSQELATAQRESLEAQMADARNLYEGGFATRTDVEETKARVHVARAAETAAGNALDLRRREVERMIGGRFNELKIASVGKIDLLPPDPADPHYWIDTARRQNLKVLAQELAREIADHQVDRAKAGHLPSAAVVASAQKARNPNYFTQREQVNSLTLQIELPLFSGGGVSAQGEQAEFMRLRADHQLEDARREAELRASQYFLEVLNGIARIQALTVALESSEISLNGMVAGQKVGLRTNTDVLSARQQLFNVKRDLQKERYAYILSRLELQGVLGLLYDEDN